MYKRQGTAYDAGANALWSTDWKDVPIRDKADLVAEVMSGNELLGRMTMSVLDIVKEIPVHKAAESPDGSVPMEIMNKCAYGEPSTKTIMIMGAVAAVLASITVYCIVSCCVEIKLQAPHAIVARLSP